MRDGAGRFHRRGGRPRAGHRARPEVRLPARRRPARSRAREDRRARQGGRALRGGPETSTLSETQYNYACFLAGRGGPPKRANGPNASCARRRRCRTTSAAGSGRGSGRPRPCSRSSREPSDYAIHCDHLFWLLEFRSCRRGRAALRRSSAPCRETSASRHTSRRAITSHSRHARAARFQTGLSADTGSRRSQVPAPPSLSLRQIERPVRRTVGSLDVEVRPKPLTLVVRNRAGRLVPATRLREGRHALVPARRSAGARHGRGRAAARRRADRGASSRSSSIAAVSSTRWSRAGRATCTARAIRSRCSFGTQRLGALRRDAVGAGRPARPGSRRVRPVEAERPTSARRRPSATSSRTWARDSRRSAASFRACSTVFVFDAHDPAAMH